MIHYIPSAVCFDHALRSLVKQISVSVVTGKARTFTVKLGLQAAALLLFEYPITNPDVANTPFCLSVLFSGAVVNY